LEQSRSGGHDLEVFLVPQNRTCHSRSGGHDLEAVGDDAAAVALNQYAIECKRYSSVTPGLIGRWWEQATEQAAKVNRKPVLAFRADRQGWTICLPLAALNPAFNPEWDGIEWTAQVSLEAFCTLVREEELFRMS
jgi:hypothetical protein